MLKKGADPTLLNDDNERPIDLCDSTDFATISVMLQHSSSNNSAACDSTDDELRCEGQQAEET